MGDAERVGNKDVQKTPQQQQKNPFSNFKKPQGCDGNCGACPMMKMMLKNILSLPEAEQQEKLNEIKNMNAGAHKIILSKLSEEKANALVEQGPAKLNDELISGKDSFLESTESPKKETPKDSAKDAEPIIAEDNRSISYLGTENTTQEIAEFRILQDIGKRKYDDGPHRIDEQRQHKHDETKGADIVSGKVGGTGYTSEQIRTDPHLRRLYGYLLGLFDSEEKPIQKKRDFELQENKDDTKNNLEKNEQQTSREESSSDEKKNSVFVDSKEKPMDNIEYRNESKIQIDKEGIEAAEQSETSGSFKEKFSKKLSKIKKKIEDFLDKKKEQKQEKSEKKEQEEKEKEEKKKNEQKPNSKKSDEKENRISENNKEQKKEVEEEKQKEQEEKQEKQKEDTKKKTKEEKGDSEKIEEKQQEFEFQKKIKVFFKKEGLSEETITELLLILFDGNKSKRSRALEKLTEKQKKILIKLFKCKSWEEVKSLLSLFLDNKEQNKLK
ncbi:hypothetical protein KAW38_03470 [Candidatus Micrarchaeota archaeon]|nr:hypothetical protein [Candidatus Micrarchaeota archaeon]